MFPTELLLDGRHRSVGEGRDPVECPQPDRTRLVAEVGVVVGEPELVGLRSLGDGVPVDRRAVLVDRPTAGLAVEVLKLPLAQEFDRLPDVPLTVDVTREDDQVEFPQQVRR